MKVTEENVNAIIRRGIRTPQALRDTEGFFRNTFLDFLLLENMDLQYNSRLSCLFIIDDDPCMEISFDLEGMVFTPLCIDNQNFQDWLNIWVQDSTFVSIINIIFCELKRTGDIASRQR